MRDSPSHLPKETWLPQSYKIQSSTWLNKPKPKMWQENFVSPFRYLSRCKITQMLQERTFSKTFTYSIKKSPRPSLKQHKICLSRICYLKSNRTKMKKRARIIIWSIFLGTLSDLLNENNLSSSKEYKYIEYTWITDLGSRLLNYKFFWTLCKCEHVSQNIP